MQRVNVFKYADPDVDGSETHLNGWFDLDKAVEIAELTRWDGDNRVSVHVPKFHHNALYRTAGGRWVLQSWSQWQGTMERYEYIDDERAREWLTVNESDDIVEQYFGEVEEEAQIGRPRVGTLVGVRVPDDVLADVDAIAERRYASRSQMVREAITDFIERERLRTGGDQSAWEADMVVRDDAISAKLDRELAAPLPDGVTRSKVYPFRPHGQYNTVHGWECPDCGATNLGESWLWVTPAAKALAHHRQAACLGRPRQA